MKEKEIKLVLLTASEKFGKKCVVGYEESSRCFYRLVSTEGGEGISADYLNNIDLLEEVQVKILSNCPLNHQTENVRIDLSYGINPTGKSSPAVLTTLAKTKNTIFGDRCYKLNNADNLDYSVEVVDFDSMKFYNVNNKTKVNFKSNGNIFENYSVTDEKFFFREREISSGIAVITIPPCDDFTETGGFFKFIAAIYVYR